MSNEEERKKKSGEFPAFPLVAEPRSAERAYFLFYALLKDKQSVNLAACDILQNTQRVMRNNIPESLTDEIHTDNVPRPQRTSLFRQKMTEIYISWLSRKSFTQ